MMLIKNLSQSEFERITDIMDFKEETNTYFVFRLKDEKNKAKIIRKHAVVETKTKRETETH